MRERTTLLSLLLAALLFASPVTADDRDRFSGKWVLDIKASKLERPPVFSEVTLEYLGNGTNDISLKARWVQKDGSVHTRNYTYVCDGESQEIQETEDQTRAANAVWDEDNLKIESTMTVMGTEFTADSEWVLTDENTIERRNHVKHPLNESKWTEIYRRKGSK